MEENSKKRKHEDDIEDTSNKSQKVEDLVLYKEFNKFPIDILNQIRKENSKKLISGPLSYRIAYQWLTNSTEKIELVKTNQLWKFKEYDRLVEGKFSNENLEEKLNLKCSSILKRGIYEPLQLIYHNLTGECYLNEGNTRLTWARANNIEYLPVFVHVLHTKNIEKHEKALKQVKFNENVRKIAPLEIGFSSFQNFPFHPYFSQELSERLNLEYFEKSPNDDSIIEALSIDEKEKKS